MPRYPLRRRRRFVDEDTGDLLLRRARSDIEEGAELAAPLPGRFRSLKRKRGLREIERGADIVKHVRFEEADQEAEAARILAEAAEREAELASTEEEAEGEEVAMSGRDFLDAAEEVVEAEAAMEGAESADPMGPVAGPSRLPEATLDEEYAMAEAADRAQSAYEIGVGRARFVDTLDEQHARGLTSVCRPNLEFPASPVSGRERYLMSSRLITLRKECYADIMRAEKLLRVLGHFVRPTQLGFMKYRRFLPPTQYQRCCRVANELINVLGVPADR